MNFDAYFTALTKIVKPHPWQAEVGAESRCFHRLLRVPTGFGKTAGVVLPWLYHRVERSDIGWPTRLAVCLPMRVLVEQTERAVRAWLAQGSLSDRVSVNVLMGGMDGGDWLLAPEKPAILIGTQDMLLSRALNRGYGSGRARWPMELGLLGADALWVFDEIQLMDVGLATAAQLAAFRQQDATKHGAVRPSATWFMSATLQPAWLETVDFRETASRIAREVVHVPATQRTGGLWEVRKVLERAAAISEPTEVASLAIQSHNPGQVTLVITNTVKRARETHAALIASHSTTTGRGKAKVTALRADAPEIRLVHSQFRGHERAAWAEEFLRRDASVPSNGRIIVATQVVEAGVDISASTLLTDLAPWPSLVQRFGRVARYAGEHGRILVLGGPPKTDDKARPYVTAELISSAKALDGLVGAGSDGSPRSLEAFEDRLRKDDPILLGELFPFRPLHVIRRPDFDELFDTSTDLSGADIDVSRFIRVGEERDVSLFWRPIEKKDDRWPSSLPKRGVLPPRREELCAAPLGEVREWLSSHCAWTFDYLEGRWARVHQPHRLIPGATLLVPCMEGGYSPRDGLSLRAKDQVAAVPPAPVSGSEQALYESTEDEDDESLSETRWQTIAVHGMEVGQVVQRLSAALGVGADLVKLLELAGRWHDAGKAHWIFQSAIMDDVREGAVTAGAALAASRELAKAPKEAWRRPAYPARPGFRHELASTLALMELVRRSHPSHPALAAPHVELLRASGIEPIEETAAERIDSSHPLAIELSKLDAAELNLVAWILCTHHGKVRCQWLATPRDLERVTEKGGGAIHGVLDGESLPALDLMTAGGTPSSLPTLSLSLACASLGLNALYGESWTERVAGLIQRHGRFTLAWLEAVFRAADVLASRTAEGKS